MVAEGVNATRAAVRLAERHGVDMPIALEIHAVLFEGKPIATALSDLMGRGPADELRGLGLSGL
jgi:glycerol-3-phosphate dehydrogenase (NAD(P)+)